MFNLNKNLSYFIFLHEPDFFLVTYNPVTMPTTDTMLTFDEIDYSYMTLTLEVTLYSGVKVVQESSDPLIISKMMINNSDGDWETTSLFCHT